MLLTACEPFIDAGDITCNCADLYDPEIQGWIDQASDIIAILSGGLISGVCTDIFRPCADQACGYGRGCSCCSMPGITLPSPVVEIVSVWVDGVELDEAEYQLVDGRQLVRTDRRFWPGCQDPFVDRDEKGTFEIIVRHGLLPQLAKDAANEIVCDFIKREEKTGGKPLEPRARSANVAGVQIQLEQQAFELKKRMLMVPSLIRLLAVYAPDGPDPAVMYSPELDEWTLHQIG